MILVAIPEPLRSRILPSPLVEQLRAIAPVAVATTPDDLLAGDTRALLAEAHVLPRHVVFQIPERDAEILRDVKGGDELALVLEAA